MWKYYKFLYISLHVTSHFILHFTSCYISLHITSHFMLHFTSCYISLHVTFHFMLHLTSCYISLHVTCHFMLHLTSCYISLHVTFHFMLHLTSCYISLHVVSLGPVIFAADSAALKLSILCSVLVCLILLVGHQWGSIKCGKLKFGAETIKLSLLWRKFNNPLYFGVLPVIEYRTVRVPVSCILYRD